MDLPRTHAGGYRAAETFGVCRTTNRGLELALGTYCLSGCCFQLEPCHAWRSRC